MKIFIGAHYNLNNGDCAVLESTIQIIKHKYPYACIIVSAYKPEILKDDRFATVSWPLGSGRKEGALLRFSNHSLLRCFFKKYYRYIVDSSYIKALKDSDVVLMSGGHHLTDILGKVGYYKLALNFIPPIEMGKKVILLPQSIGPASDENIKESIRYILTHAEVIAYRDQSSSNFIDFLNINCKRYYVPDVVFNLDVPKRRSEIKEVGIALYHVYNPENREKMLSTTMKALSSIIRDLISQNYRVKIIPMDKGDREYYYRLFETIKENSNTENFVMCSEKNNVLDLVCEFSGLDFVLAYKTHAIIFSMICNTPLIAIAYHPKSIEFMQSVGLKEYSIMDCDANYDNLKALVNSVQDNLEQIKEKERDGIQKNRAKIIDFFEEID